MGWIYIFCVDIGFSVLKSAYLGLGLVNHMETLCLKFKDLPDTSKVAAPFNNPTTNPQGIKFCSSFGTFVINCHLYSSW